MARSGLAELFWQVEIVSEKDEPTYRRILARHDIDPATFVMVGNSVRSDVLPVLALGGRAIHVPYAVTWALEHVAPDPEVHDFPVLASLVELPDAIEQLQARLTHGPAHRRHLQRSLGPGVPARSMAPLRRDRGLPGTRRRRHRACRRPGHPTPARPSTTRWPKPSGSTCGRWPRPGRSCDPKPKLISRADPDRSAGDGDWCVAILSRLPITTTRSIELPDLRFDPWSRVLLQVADLDVDRRRLHGRGHPLQPPGVRDRCCHARPLRRALPPVATAGRASSGT